MDECKDCAFFQDYDSGVKWSRGIGWITTTLYSCLHLLRSLRKGEKACTKFFPRDEAE